MQYIIYTYVDIIYIFHRQCLQLRGYCLSSTGLEFYCITWEPLLALVPKMSPGTHWEAVINKAVVGTPSKEMITKTRNKTPNSVATWISSRHALRLSNLEFLASLCSLHKDILAIMISNYISARTLLRLGIFVASRKPNFGTQQYPHESIENMFRKQS